MRGNRDPVCDRPSSLRTRSNKSAESARSRTVKVGSSPIDPAWSRNRPAADRMKRPRPGQKGGRRRDARSSVAASFGQDLLAPAGHFEGSAPGEGQQQQALRVAAVQNQMSHPVGERLGFASSGAGGDQQCRRRRKMLADAISDSAALFRIEARRCRGSSTGCSFMFLFRSL